MADFRIVDLNLGNELLAPGDSFQFDYWLTPYNQLDDSQQIRTAVTIALGSDRRAKDDDELPTKDPDRRGWWGDLDAKAIWGGWPIGSRLWLLNRAKITGKNAKQGSLVVRARGYLLECLDPFITAKLWTRHDVLVTRIDDDTVRSDIKIYRGNKTAIDLQYQFLWDEIGQ